MIRFLAIFSLLVFTHGLFAGSLETVLARMDAEAPRFHAMAADVSMVTYTDILKDQTAEKGTLKMQKVNERDVRAIIDFAGERTLAFSGSKVRIYYPNLNTYQDYEFGKNNALLNQYLLLGFGSSGKDLALNYTITELGTETIAGKTTSKLQLIPKDPKALEHLTKVEVWIPDNGAYPIQQQFFEAQSGNYRKVTYSNLHVNPDFGKSKLEFKLPAKAKPQQQ